VKTGDSVLMLRKAVARLRGLERFWTEPILGLAPQALCLRLLRSLRDQSTTRYREALLTRSDRELGQL